MLFAPFTVVFVHYKLIFQAFYPQCLFFETSVCDFHSARYKHHNLQIKRFLLIFASFLAAWSQRVF